jgi:hypothetical protein
MGAGIEVEVAGKRFRTKTELKDTVRNLIAKYTFGQFLDNEDFQFCMELFRRHSDYEQKVGRGVQRIEVRRDDYGNRYFHLHRIDGTDTDISWVHCVTPKK